ncbi:hypothetical protein GCM10027059_26170 [Myceligenerans halotolerans]
MAIRIPRWLRPLVGPDEWREDGGPRNPDPLAKVTDEELDAAVAKLVASWARAAQTIDRVHLAEFVDRLRSTPPPAPPAGVPAWHPTTSRRMEQS